MKHTLGPYINKHFDGNGVVAITSASFRGPNVMARFEVPLTLRTDEEGNQHWKCTDKDVAECEANARLFMISPLLLECLARLYAVIEPDYSMAWDDEKAVIDEAANLINQYRRDCEYSTPLNGSS